MVEQMKLGRTLERVLLSELFDFICSLGGIFDFARCK